MSFGLQSLVSEYIAKNYKTFKPGIIDVPEEIDNKVGQLKLDAMGIKIDKLTETQYRYIHGYEEGT
nr:adenosylhomocysteinase [Candidatus Sigynarchaeum springense]